MFKKTITYSLIIIFSLSLFSLPVLAEEITEEIEVTADELGIEEPGVVSWFKDRIDSIRLFVARDPVKKSEIELRKVNRQLIKIKKLVRDNPDDEEFQSRLEKIDEKYKAAIERINSRVIKFKQENPEAPQLKSFLDKYTEHQLLHHQILKRIEEQVPEKAMEIIKQNRERHLEKFGETMNRLQNKEEFKERLRVGLENQGKTIKQKVKRMEVIEDLENNAGVEIRVRINEMKQERGELFQGLRTKQREIRNAR